MAGPLGMLPAGPTVNTTIVREDINGGPLGVLPAGSTAATIIVGDVKDGRPPRGCCRQVW
jgi:hypothetical protein